MIKSVKIIKYKIPAGHCICSGRAYKTKCRILYLYSEKKLTIGSEAGEEETKQSVPVYAVEFYSVRSLRAAAENMIQIADYWEKFKKGVKP
jgi:hypothetical protein